MRYSSASPTFLTYGPCQTPRTNAAGAAANNKKVVVKTGHGNPRFKRYREVSVLKRGATLSIHFDMFAYM